MCSQRSVVTGTCDVSSYLGPSRTSSAYVSPSQAHSQTCLASQTSSFSCIDEPEVSHGAIQFTAYEELRKVIVELKEKRRNSESASDLLNSADYAALGGSSKVAAVLLTYPFQVIRARLQQRPSTNGIPRYIDSLHVIREAARFEGLRGFYRGLTANLLKNVPASSITFIVYENVLKLLKQSPTKD
ncbi:hypothetical protein AALP_AA8G499700 [Arabis alpina]|uniref:Uncharacterized protein n=1 Tax=Arabis alpina TaxID=50452 RepID=A0A087GEK7_ARAAL|nr:hypothetical protein AALP_AA8G499700 [Arabis alpina]